MSKALISSGVIGKNASDDTNYWGDDIIDNVFGITYCDV